LTITLISRYIMVTRKVFLVLLLIMAMAMVVLEGLAASSLTIQSWVTPGSPKMF
jgi:hypothetical protein